MCLNCLLTKSQNSSTLEYVFILSRPVASTAQTFSEYKYHYKLKPPTVCYTWFLSHPYWCIIHRYLNISCYVFWGDICQSIVPPLWSSHQSSWLQIQRSLVWFLALPDFLRSSGSGTVFTQPREYNWGATGIKSSGSGPEIREYGHGDPLCWPRATFCPQKLALTSLISEGRSVGIVRSQIKATTIFLYVFWGIFLEVKNNH
jgi:hypothetical protein